MHELKTITDIVKEVLKSHEKARNCDDYLYYLVCSLVGKQNGFDVDNMQLSHFLLYRREYNLPAFETVRRTRQKIQQHHPELCGCDVVEGYRTVNEEKFRSYARGIV